MSTGKSALAKIYRRLDRAYGPQGWWPARSPFEVIVGAILTQNTAWTNVEKAIRNLRARGLLSYRAIGRSPTRRLAEAIRPSGFFNVKARRLKAFTAHVARRHGGRLGRLLGRPAGPLRQELLAVPGIGPETADSILLYAAKKPVFVVDAYTKRIFHRLGLCRSARHGGPDYERFRRFFEERLRPDPALFNQFHALIVRHAKTHCRRRPICAGCPLETMCAKHF
jgi:endonuclease-3 related protein